MVFDGARAHVWVAQTDKKRLEIRPAGVGRNRERLIEITDGSILGEPIVTSGGVFIDRAASGD